MAISAPGDTLRQGDSIQLSAVARDPSGNPLTGIAVEWRSADPAVASIGADGLLRGVGHGRTLVYGLAVGKKDSLAVEVRVRWKSVSLGVNWYTACALALDGKAFCWGAAPHRFGASAGTVAVPDSVPGGLRYASLATTGSTTCGIARNATLYCWGARLVRAGGDTVSRSPVPEQVATPVPLVSLAAGSAYFCGLATDGRAFCWGSDSSGQLGVGATSSESRSDVPVEVGGNLRFSSLDAGVVTTCGVTTAGEAYCWGWNSYGQVGDGVVSWQRSFPTRVSTDRKFLDVNPGYYHTCGVATTGDGFCWGSFTLGDGRDSFMLTERRPVPVASTERFVRMDSGWGLTCGLNDAGRAFCWGGNAWGGIGDGTTTTRNVPTAVKGDLAFATLAAGASVACGIMKNGVMYCWGANTGGVLGNGTTEQSLVPARVSDPRL